MHPPSRSIALVVLAASLASLIAYAAQPTRQDSGAEPSADLLPSAAQRRLSPTALQTAKAASPIVANASPTPEEVGDADSFGRAAKWLGVAQMNVALTDICPLPGDDETACVVVNPAPAGTAFSFEDVARITLPGKAADSLLCHWLSPILDIEYANPTAAAVIASIAYRPTLTVESEVLDDPALVDATTGLPFNGRLQTGMTASERFEVPLGAGQQVSERVRDSAVCIAGFLTRRALVETYGLAPAQAKQVFKKPITVRMNISGNAQYVGNANLMFGFRIVGD